MGIAVGEDAVYVGDNGLQRVLTFKRDGLRRDGSFTLAGEAVGYQGPVAALALDGQGSLLVHTGTSLAPVRLAINRGYRTEGMLWSRQAIHIGGSQGQLASLAGTDGSAGTQRASEVLSLHLER